MTAAMGFDYDTLVEQVTAIHPDVKYVLMGAESFAAFHSEGFSVKGVLTKDSIVAVYDCALPPQTVVLYDASRKVLHVAETPAA